MEMRSAQADDFDAILAVINDAALACRGAIPPDCWHEPYMSGNELKSEPESHVVFSVLVFEGRVHAVMGIQDERYVALVRHAYTAAASQGRGFGTALLHQLESVVQKPLLFGTWTFTGHPPFERILRHCVKF